MANSFATSTGVSSIRARHTQLPPRRPLARFAVAQTCAGRRVGGQLSIHDVSSRHCQQNRGVTLQCSNRIDQATGAWEQILVEDRSSTPADIAATVRIDFGELAGVAAPAAAMCRRTAINWRKHPGRREAVPGDVRADQSAPQSVAGGVGKCLVSEAAGVLMASA